MRTFHHITLEEREKLYGWQKEGLSLREIAKKLGRSHTSLSRELHRNAKYGNSYLPCRAQKKADKRTVRQRRKAPLKSSLVYLYTHLTLVCIRQLAEKKQIRWVYTEKTGCKPEFS